MKTVTFDETKWRLVPIEPTKEMCIAAVKFANGNAVYKNVAHAALEIEEGIYGETYAAMLAASPSPRTPRTARTAFCSSCRCSDEWLAIPGLWLECMAERDRLRARWQHTVRCIRMDNFGGYVVHPDDPADFNGIVAESFVREVDAAIAKEKQA